MPPELMRSMRAMLTVLCAAFLIAMAPSAPAYAQTAKQLARQVAHLAQEVENQRHRLDQQESKLREQQSLIQSQLAELERRAGSAGAGPIETASLDEMRGGGYAHLASAAPILLAGASAAADAAPVSKPVGEAPATETNPVEAPALPEGQGVLTQRGRLTLDPSLEYSRSTSDRLVYRGVEIVTGVQVGLLEANTADRDTTSAAITARYGLTNRIEIEGRLPYVYRSDRVTTVAQRDTQVTRTDMLRGSGIGDLEGAIRYQVTRGLNHTPVVVAGLRVKADNATGPFDVARDSAGVATKLAVGSGFLAVSPSLSFLLPSDPAVIFANVGYTYTPEKNINQVIGKARVGHVDPGDSISAGLGFGFALNQNLSYSLGYSHSYITGTKSELGATKQTANSLSVGAMQFGMSYRLNDRVTLAANVDVGATKDAPDMRAVIRVPVSLQVSRAPTHAARNFFTAIFDRFR